VEENKPSSIVASRKELLAMLSGGKIQNAIQRCYEAYGNDLYGD